MRKVVKIFLAILIIGVTGSSVDAGNLRTDGQLVTTQTDGPPLTVSGIDPVIDLHVDRLDNLEGSNLPRSPANIVTVGLTGANFSSVKKAVDSITDASASNQYLIWIGPGVFSEVEIITLDGYIHLEGSGRDETSVQAQFEITGPTQMRSFEIDAPGIASDSEALFILSTTADLYDLKILHSVSGIVTSGPATISMDSISVVLIGGSVSTGIRLGGHINDRSTTTLTDVTVRVEDTNPFHTVRGISIGLKINFRGEGLSVFVSGSGDQHGVFSDQSESVVITDSDFEVTPSPGTDTATGLLFIRGPAVELARISVLVNDGGTGVAQDGASSLQILNSRIEVGQSDPSFNSWGVYSAAGGSIFHSEIHAPDVTVLAESSTSPTRVSHSHLAGGAVGGTGTVECRWVTDEGFGNFSLSCP